jgi:two-component sensor histidine kinase
MFPRAVPLAIFLLVMSIAAVSCFAIERGERRSQSAQLKERAVAVASALERRVNANAAYLRAGAALLSTQNDIPPSQFRSFVGELRLDADYRGADGIGWARRVDHHDVAAFNALLKREYGEAVEIHPSLVPGQPFAIPVTFLEPDTLRNRRALGFDMYSEKGRRSAMVEAERMARPIASGKVVLEQEGASNAPGFLIYMPVFESASGGPRLKGFVYSAFNAQNFLSSVLQTEATGNLRVQIYDELVRQDRLLAGSSPSGADEAKVQQSFVIAGHRWVLVISRAGAAALSPLAIVTLLFGLAAAGLLALVAQILTQQAREDGARLSWFEEQNAIRDSLTRELNHRVKNTLANVLSIVALTRRRASTIDEFAEGLDGRIRALSATHDLLTQSDWGPTPIGAVIEAELAPYAREAGPFIEMTGPQIDLAPSDALSLGLAIHELATNAAKYGALSVPGGRLAVEWMPAGPAQAKIDWTEAGGPPVPAQRGRGFGMDLIEKIVAHELQSPVKMDFATEGLRCTLLVPVRAPRPFAIRSGG